MVIMKSQTRVKLTIDHSLKQMSGVSKTPKITSRVLTGPEFCPDQSHAFLTRPTATASCKRAHRTKLFNRAIQTQNMPHSIGHSSTRTHPNRPSNMDWLHACLTR